MMRTIKILTKQNSVVSDYFNRVTTTSRALRNRANFLIRNTMTGLNKYPTERTALEIEALHTVFTGLQKANEAFGEDRFKFPTAFKWMLSYIQLDAIFKFTNDKCYYNCPAQENQQILKSVVSSWSSYFKARRDYKKHPEKYLGKPRIPGYIKDKQSTAMFTNQIARLVNRDGKLYLHFSKCDEIYIGPERLQCGKYIKTAVKPDHGRYAILITFEDGLEEPAVPKSPKIMMGIDTGVNNLMTCVINDGKTYPLIIDGRHLKSVNQKFNKDLGFYTSCLKKSGQSVQDRSKKLNKISLDRENQIRDFLSKASHKVFQYAKDHDVELIVFAHNEEEKQNDPLHNTVQNQNFVNIPYTQLMQCFKTLSCKYGVPVIFREESYTSQASLLNFDHMPPHPVRKKDKPVFSGKRPTRGKYVTKDNCILNADVNGAGNILRKEYPHAFDGVNDFTYLMMTVNVLKYNDLYPRAVEKSLVSNKKDNQKSKNSAIVHRVRSIERLSLKHAFG